MDNESVIIVGKINGFYGLKGYLKVFSETRPRDAILDYKELKLKLNGAWKTFEIADSKIASKSLVIKFKGFEDRTSVEHLLGTVLAIEKSQLPKLPKEQFYWSELIGMQVESINGYLFGKVNSLIETGANDVLVVDHHGKDCLIPFTMHHTIVSVDLEQGVIIVDWEEDAI